MCKTMWQTIVLRVIDQRDFLANFLENSERLSALGGIVVGMHAKIEQCEFYLTQHGKCLAEIPATVQAVKDFPR